MNVTIDESALLSMQSLLGEQFNDTLVFCCSEFERLESEVMLALHGDMQSAIRNAHSLKSNAAQFGALSLSNTAREIEQALIKDEHELAKEIAQGLAEQVAGSKAKLNAWLDANG
ncbi:Hpt domain-containing protein [Pseudoalteromonas xiamenensis]|uniref:Hpt domain-containing protein n=1 Tax=Pseudoalteromonas xiamenensis TaxID=882626 RepID=A0A975HL65_9GAMM|nr:Hpt domain-containing protein [Pseudoalteromonas xiamenensis]QTH71768.1 Hpt domain-containing protein [Pseudoalteromonas xiamenensis]WMN60186.1 Hpt domain-containing protein [Pseudoalteromonas xiamenensis]